MSGASGASPPSCGSSLSLTLRCASANAARVAPLGMLLAARRGRSKASVLRHARAGVNQRTLSSGLAGRVVRRCPTSTTCARVCDGGSRRPPEIILAWQRSPSVRAPLHFVYGQLMWGS